MLEKELTDVCDIDFSVYDEGFLNKIIHHRKDFLNLYSENDYINYLQGNNYEQKILSDSLINNFSEFFRDKLTFSYLEQIVLPKLIQEKTNSKQKEIRIWSAACSAGQEAYSIAILCDELVKRIETELKFRIFATDLSEVEIQKATNGIYTESALYNVTKKRFSEYFSTNGIHYKINDNLKNYINFSTFNLLDDENESPTASIFGSFDIVFCSNLLFYYNPNAQLKILTKIANNLNPLGYLITGETEKFIIHKNLKFTYIDETSIAQKL